MNPINKPAAPAVGWQQARVLEMQAEYADAFDTQTGSYDEMCAAYGEERKMWNSGGPEMEETIEYQVSRVVKHQMSSRTQRIYLVPCVSSMMKKEKKLSESLRM